MSTARPVCCGNPVMKECSADAVQHAHMEYSHPTTGANSWYKDCSTPIKEGWLAGDGICSTGTLFKPNIYIHMYVRMYKAKQ